MPYPESAGIPAVARHTLIVVPFNDPAALIAAFDKHGPEIAALVMEPVNYDSGCIPPEPGFAQLCRELCTRHGALLFFDEVLTAFRMAPGGAQQYLGVTPDLAVLGKAFGAGMPISAVAGTREVMRAPAPDGARRDERHVSLPPHRRVRGPGGAGRVRRGPASMSGSMRWANTSTAAFRTPSTAAG